MATLSDLRTYVAQDLGDPSNATFSTAEIDDLINQGIDALADVYPREIMQTIGTVAAGVYSYSVSDFSNIYRVDIYTSAGSYRTTLENGIGEGPNSGWELHGGVLYMPPSWTLTTGDTLRAWGYARYVQLSASTSTTNLDTSGIWAVRVFARAEAFHLLASDRVKFQQWQADSNNTDVTSLAVAQMAAQAAGRWDREQRRLRRLTKRG